MWERAIDALPGQTDARRGCFEPGQISGSIGPMRIGDRAWFLDESPAGGYFWVDVTSFNAAWTRWNSWWILPRNAWTSRSSLPALACSSS